MYNIDFSLINGLGKPSVSIYFSGCDIPIKCKECHNPELWSKQESKVDYDELCKLINSSKAFSKNLIVSFLGGEPLSPNNRNKVKEIANQLKKGFPGIQLVIYSWRLPKDIKDEWIKDFDYGVLGKFNINNLQKGYLPASANQIIYDFKKKEKRNPIKISK